MIMQKRIMEVLRDSIMVKQSVLEDPALLSTIEQIVDETVRAFKNGNKVLFCGNGGSAADAQHLAAEFSGRYYFDREPLFAEALHVNTSYLTAVANDYSYDEIYARMIRAEGRAGDILIGLSTSGNSKNIINAFDAADALGMITIAFTGKTGGEIKQHCRYLINVPSTDTPRIQESHITIGHILCELVEQIYFKGTVR